MNRFCLYILLILCVSFLWTCGEIEEYSEVPLIEYVDNVVSYETHNDEIVRKNVELQFSILDGDGDVGLSSSDTGTPYKDTLVSNFFSEIYVRKENKWVSGQELGILGTNYRMPYMGEGYSAILKANVFVEFSYSATLFPYDSIKYSFYIVDRALNKSNVDTSSVIVFIN